MKRTLRFAIVVLAPTLVLTLLHAGSSMAIPAGGIIENRGQLNEAARYYALGTPATVFFTNEGIVIDLREPSPDAAPEGGLQGDVVPRNDREADSGQKAGRGCAVWIRFEGANPSPAIEPRGELPTRFNYFLGNDPQRWPTDVPSYREIVYRDLWPGLDLVYRDEAGRLAYELLATDGAQTELARFRYEGADRVTALSDGSWLVETPAGSLIDVRPSSRGDAGTILAGGPADDAQSDAGGRDFPAVLEWSTFLGGSLHDVGCAIRLDNNPSGNPIVTGGTDSSDFPTTPGAYDRSFNGDRDVFVARFSAAGDALEWCTFLGGSGHEMAFAMDFDSSEDLFLTGHTSSTDFPTTWLAYDLTHNGGADAFVAKLSSSGNSLLWSTFLGGSSFDRGLAIDFKYYMFVSTLTVAGLTESSDFPTTAGAFDRTYGGNRDLFVTRISLSGDALVWSTYLGGTDEEPIWGSGLYGGSLGLESDNSHRPVVASSTQSSDFPVTAGSYDTSHNGSSDGLVSMLASSGDALVWSTFLGGNDWDGATAIDVSSYAILVAGYTRSQ